MSDCWGMNRQRIQASHGRRCWLEYQWAVSFHGIRHDSVHSTLTRARLVGKVDFGVRSTSSKCGQILHPEVVLMLVRARIWLSFRFVVYAGFHVKQHDSGRTTNSSC